MRIIEAANNLYQKKLISIFEKIEGNFLHNIEEKDALKIRNAVYETIRVSLKNGEFRQPDKNSIMQRLRDYITEELYLKYKDKIDSVYSPKLQYWVTGTIRKFLDSFLDEKIIIFGKTIYNEIVSNI